ncbi:AarF/UbiB family protein [Wenzhouxiangella sp. XN24]|uniref:ABC1 kinase family protein n=1 Tax=Wenzhouxiangella sp. XN24 TaxID=2713569 RepID=UPI0013EA6074|nr:AarF/UbiB family protein [Wenzhouxiangella sp. XN24]NGX15044.1 AarF/ABC1/UbiB kinase family protein [Wenzhouxiangella sp. XN24]
MSNAAELLGLTVKGALRLGQTGRVLAGTGVSWLMGDRPPPPRLVRQTFERLGATYVKLGQFIASSPSMFPEPWVTEFQHCLDRTSPLPWRTIRRALREELGDKVESEFSWIDPEPLASASIAQVHAARLKTGEDVVLKVRKPGVEKVIVTDLNLLYLVARVAERVTPGAAHASLAAIVEEIQGSMMEECDFVREAANIEAFRVYLDDTLNRSAAVPRVYPALSTGRVLTMERFFGASLTDPAGLRRCTDDPEGLLVTALNTWFGSLMHCRTFHADLHAGNLMALRDGRIGFIDFGIVGRIREETWRAMFALADGLPRGDFKAVAEGLATMGATREGVDTARLATDLEALFRRLDLAPGGPGDAADYPVYDEPPEDEDLNRALMELVAVGRRHGIRFPREFTLLVKQFLYFDRYIRMLAPDLALFGDARVNALPSLG